MELFDNKSVTMNVSKPLLLLTHNYGPDTQVVWRAAINNGWNTERVGTARIDIDRKILGFKKIRYYGDMLHQSECGDNLPINFIPIDISNLTRLKEFTGRHIELIRASDVKLPIQETLVFYKCPGIKWIQSRVYKHGEIFDCKPDDWLYRQEPVEFIDEIRCFVKDGQILTSSWYRKNKHFLPKILNDNVILEKLQNLTSGLWKEANWPNGIVFDFGRLGNGKWLFIECNESWASGTYDCDGRGVLESIEASQK